MIRMVKNNKPTVGFYDLSGCNGCLLSIVFNEDEFLDLTEHLDIKEFRLIQNKKKTKKLDVVFVEGLVASNADLELLKQIRKNSKIVIALGTCSCTGCIPAYRNFEELSKYLPSVQIKEKSIEDVPATPINEHIDVDYYLPGCPPDKKQISDFVKDLLLGKNPYEYDKPVCFECKLNENRCLLDDGKMCFGPITRGGCDAICTNGKLECWGCRGTTPDADIPLMKELLGQKGFTKEHVQQRLRTFAGMQIEKPKLKLLRPLKTKRKLKKKAPKLKPAKKHKLKSKPAVKSKRTLKKSKKVSKKKKSKRPVKKTKKSARLKKKKRIKKKSTRKAKPKKKPKKRSKTGSVRRAKPKKKVLKKKPKRKVVKKKIKRVPKKSKRKIVKKKVVKKKTVKKRPVKKKTVKKTIKKPRKGGPKNSVKIKKQKPKKAVSKARKAAKTKDSRRKLPKKSAGKKPKSFMVRLRRRLGN